MYIYIYLSLCIDTHNIYSLGGAFAGIVNPAGIQSSEPWAMDMVLRDEWQGWAMESHGKSPFLIGKSTINGDLMVFNGIQ